MRKVLVMLMIIMSVVALTSVVHAERGGIVCIKC